MRLSYIIFICVLILNAYGCSSSNESTPSEISTDSEPTQTNWVFASLDENTVIYNGSTGGSALSLVNIPGLIGSVLDTKSEITTPGPLYFQSDSSATGREYFNETIECGDGGSIVYNGSDSEGETFQAEHIECRTGSLFTNGVTLNEYTTRTSSEIEHLATHINFAVINDLEILPKDILKGGTVHFHAQRLNNLATATLNYDLIDNLKAVEIRYQDLSITAVYDNISSPLSAQLSFNGRLYYSSFGYIEVTTITPLCYSSLSEHSSPGKPDCGGELIFTGQDGALVRLVVVSNTQVQLFVDINPIDGTEEANYIVSWSNLDFDTSL